MIFSSRLHEHADPAQRAQGVAALPADSPVIAQLLAGDPSPEVRAAAAKRSSDAAALTTALKSESEPAVRAAIVAALGEALASQDDSGRSALLDRIEGEDALVDIALGAERATARAAAAERVHSPEPLRRLLKGARDKDRGVARLARTRLDAIESRSENTATADELLQRAEALLADPGPILMAAVELDRRWKTLTLAEDDVRCVLWQELGRRMQQRFDREHDAQRARAQFEQRLDGWLAALQPPESPAALPALREQLDALRAEANASDNERALTRLNEAEQKLVQWERVAPALAAAEALVLEAEQLADGTPADDAQLPTRWHAVDMAGRTPPLTRRFEAALLVIEKRRLAVIRAAEQEQGNARHELHTALHEAEQALAGGHLHEARAAADRTRALKPHAGNLPKPTIQRLSRVVQQLVDLERWQQFGQHTARIQLAERAEALSKQTLSPTALAREVQQLRAEWKKLDEQMVEKTTQEQPTQEQPTQEQPTQEKPTQQKRTQDPRAGVPKPLWDRFDAACERAYAPAARHFAEQAALHKQARKQRDDFIDAAAAHVPTLATEPRDWRAIERWLRDTESAWRDKALGSVEPGVWKKLDTKLKAALAPLHRELTTARQQARQEREVLIAEAESLAAKAGERDTPSRIKELQARWQVNARTITLPQRDERTLWERFRGACNAVFEARTGSRKADFERKTTQRRAFEALLEQAEQLGKSTEMDEAQLRRGRHELQEQWKAAVAEHGAPPAALEARFRAARSHAEEAVRGKAKATEAGTWQTLFAKERLCEELDVVAGDEAEPDAEVASSVQQRWDALPALPAEWEQKVAGRRDAALAALPDIDERYYYGKRIEQVAAERRDLLLEMELMLGIPSPADLQPHRLAVQVKQLRSRFKRDAGGADNAQALLLSWCSLPGRTEERDRKRCEAIVARLQRHR